MPPTLTSNSPSASIRILLLGPPAVFADGQPCTIQRRLLRGILFYLAAQARPVSRGELISLFWPEEDEESGRARLRVALSKLRHELPEGEALVVFQDQVSLDLQRIYVDVYEFESLVQQTARSLQLHAGMQLPESAYQQLLKAANLWRSPRFMDGVRLTGSSALDDWLIATAESLLLERQTVHMHLAEHLTLSGDIASSLRWLLEAAEMDPFNDELHQRVLAGMHSLGRRADGLRYFEKIRKTYEKENIPFSPELLQLRSELNRESAAAPAGESSGWLGAVTLQARFVGQAELLRRLRLAFARGGVEVIAGEIGSGKSRLVHELYQSLDTAPRLLATAAHSHETNLPFQPLIDLLRHNIQEDEWLSLDLSWVSALSLLLPELSALRPDLPSRAGTDLLSARTILFEAMRQLLLLLARRQRLLVFLDDAHWADELTLQALAYLQERGLFNEHGLLVLASGLEQCQPRLEPYFCHPHNGSSPEQMVIGPLQSADIAELAHVVLGEEPPEALVRSLEADSGGNPFFLLEILRAMLNFSPRPALEHFIDRLPLSSSIHGLARERLQTLSLPAHQTLVTAAVIGRIFRLDVLEAAANLSPEAVVEAVEELENCYLLRPHVLDEYEFIHGKIREVLLLELSEARKRLLHQRVARAIELRCGALPAHAEALARHYELAGEKLAAFSYWLMHAQQSAQCFRRDEALVAFQRAESLLLRSDNSLPDSQVYQLYHIWARMAEDAEDLESMERSYAAMLRSGEERHSNLLIGAARSGLAYCLNLHNQPEKALNQMTEAMTLLAQTGHLSERVRAYNRTACSYVRLHRLEDARRALLDGYELAKTAVEEPAWETRVDNEIQQAELQMLMGWPARAYDQARLALAHAYRLRRAIPAASARGVLAEAAFMLGRYEEAIEIGRAALDVAAAMPSWKTLISLRLISARACYCLGRMDDAWNQTQTALQFARQNNFVDLAGCAHALMGDMLRVLGDTDAAITEYQLGISEAIDRGSAMETYYRMAMALAERGRISEARSLAEQALVFARQSGTDRLRLPAEMALGLVLAWEKDLPGALEAAQRVSAEASERGLATVPLWEKSLRAKMLLQSGQYLEAIREAEVVSRVGREIGHPWTEMGGLTLQIRAARRAGLPYDEFEDQRALIFQRLFSFTLRPDLRLRLEQYRKHVLSSET